MADFIIKQTCELAPLAKKSEKYNKFVAGSLTFTIDYEQVCI